ncbi:MAG: PorP/SprF family type IX secretion system membrane protein [Bacteroidales bacterium]|nr:PorP/SprF family type IX secretion system membrane protein [Bacteroidales bacterium]
MNRYPFLLLLVIPIFLSIRKAEAQDDVIYRNNFIHPALLNPAITGSEYYPLAFISYQKQWVGIPQSPQTMLASTSVRIGNFDFYNPTKLINTSNLKSRERIGLGLTLFGDRNGPATQRGFNIAYAYHLVLDQARLSLGLSGSAEQRMVDESIFSPFDPNDPILTNTRQSFMLYNANVGAYYYSPRLFAGLAVHHIIPSENKLHAGTLVRPDIILHGGYLFSALGSPKLEISMNARFLDFEQFEYDLHVRSYIQEYHWLAVSIRSYKALAMHVGIKISAIHLAYTYEANLSNIVWYNMGTHALHLGINMGLRRTEGF